MPLRRPPSTWAAAAAVASAFLAAAVPAVATDGAAAAPAAAAEAGASRCGLEEEEEGGEVSSLLQTLSSKEGAAWGPEELKKWLGGLVDPDKHKKEEKDGCPPPGYDSVQNFDVADYISAPWYSQLQAVNSYQAKDELYCVRANYTETRPPKFSKAKKELIVDNYARRGAVDGRETSEGFTLRASITNVSEPSKLVVGPRFLPVRLRGDYWVVAVGGSPYEWAIITGGPPTQRGKGGGCVGARESFWNRNGNGEGLWLFTRAPMASTELKAKMVAQAKSLGLDTSVLLPVTQAGCCGARYGFPCPPQADTAGQGTTEVP